MLDPALGESQAQLLEQPAPLPGDNNDGRRCGGFWRDMFTLAVNDLQEYCSELWSLLRCGSGEVDAAVLTSIAEAVDGHDVVIFTKIGCPYCQRASALLQTQQDSRSTQPGFSVFSSPGTDRETRAALSHSLSVASVTFPVVFIGGVFAGGADELVELVELGEFDRLLQTTRPGPFRAGAYLCSRTVLIVCGRLFCSLCIFCKLERLYVHTVPFTFVAK